MTDAYGWVAAYITVQRRMLGRLVKAVSRRAGAGAISLYFNYNILVMAALDPCPLDSSQSCRKIFPGRQLDARIMEGLGDA